MFILDGCHMFEPSGPNESPEAMVCAACRCHRNFHRRVLVDLPPRPHEMTPSPPRPHETTPSPPRPHELTPSSPRPQPASELGASISQQLTREQIKD
ncbi:zinc-finger homeodomain protein 2 [Phtheirospermum japonicum]|uniref:Zinc-finger homeodomain protein 2 n=1 Tax=Phtheirospermum japonicum TaxID=374723 RepID=A0A830DEB4_9LAMI|nr:zinc-finger homeodomain protein 2 [Phtheirospermum japonicum]